MSTTDQTVKNFTEADVNASGRYPTIYCDRSELLYDPPKWMANGLQQTASGYGMKLNSGLKISFNGKLYRIYVTCFGNSGAAWFVAAGRKVYVN